MPRHKVRVRVTESRGNCPVHKVGDTIYVERNKMDGSICPTAFTAISQYVMAAKCGGDFPWERKDTTKTLVCCPDVERIVVFEVQRLEQID